MSFSLFIFYYFLLFISLFLPPISFFSSSTLFFSSFFSFFLPFLSSSLFFLPLSFPLSFPLKLSFRNPNSSRVSLLFPSPSSSPLPPLHPPPPSLLSPLRRRSGASAIRLRSFVDDDFPSRLSGGASASARDSALLYQRSLHGCAEDALPPPDPLGRGKNMTDATL